MDTQALDKKAKSSFISPNHLFLNKRPDSLADSFRSQKVNSPAKEVLQEEGEVHEVPEGRILELHKYIDIACLCLFPSDKRAKETYALYSEAFLDLLFVASKDIDYFQGETPLTSFYHLRK